MFYAKLPIGDVGIKFTHIENYTYLPHPGKVPKKVVHRATVCSLSYIDQNPIKLISLGKANCHDHDQFVKAKGRKLALRRALDTSLLAKNYREIVWKAYLERTPVPNEIAAKVKMGTVH